MATNDEVCEAIAKSLREFGYPDVTSRMVADVLTALNNDASEMPHGVIGMFAQSQFKELVEQGWQPT